jgi:hypothetical protein
MPRANVLERWSSLFINSGLGKQNTTMEKFYWVIINDTRARIYLFIYLLRKKNFGPCPISEK